MDILHNGIEAKIFLPSVQIIKRNPFLYYDKGNNFLPFFIKNKICIIWLEHMPVPNIIYKRWNIIFTFWIKLRCRLLDVYTWSTLHIWICNNSVAFIKKQINIFVPSEIKESLGKFTLWSKSLTIFHEFKNQSFISMSLHYLFILC